MKNILIYIIVITLFGGCSKDDKGEQKIERFCYDKHDIKFDFNVPDTLHFGEPITINGYVNYPLTMKFTIDTLFIGEIIEYGDFIWTPTKDKLKAGTQSVGVQIKICNIPDSTFIIGAYKKTFLK